MSPALRVVPEMVPCRVIRRSFGMNKLRFSCLAWRHFSNNRNNLIIVNSPFGYSRIYQL